VPRPRITQYGIYRTEAGEISVFTVGKGGPLPPNVLDMGETRRASRHTAWKATEMGHKCDTTLRGPLDNKHTRRRK
jgi:hypothetical protein